MTLEARHLTATRVFELEDAFARARGVRGPHPRVDGPLRMLAVARIVAGAREELSPTPQLELWRNDSGYDLFFGIVRSGRGPRERLAAGRYAIRVDTGGRYREVELPDVDVPEPADPYHVDLEPGFAYPFPGSAAGRGGGPTLLRGVLQGADGTGVAAAEVEVAGITGPYRTNASGQWVLAFPDDQPSGNVSVTLRLPGATLPIVVDVVLEAGRDQTLRQTSLRGSVTAARGAPVRGALITVSGELAAASTGVNGAWTYVLAPDHGAGDVDVTARLADGSRQTVAGVHVRPRMAVVVPTFEFA